VYYIHIQRDSHTIAEHMDNARTLAQKNKGGIISLATSALETAKADMITLQVQIEAWESLIAELKGETKDEWSNHSPWEQVW